MDDITASNGTPQQWQDAQQSGSAQQPTASTQMQPTQAQQQTTSAPGATATNSQASTTAQQPHITAAQRVHDIAQTMAGGPRVITVSNPDGSVAQQRVPLSGRQIGLAIALEALTGGLAGLGAKGTNHIGQAAERGLQLGMQQQQQRQQAQQQDYERARQQNDDRYKKIAQQAAVAEVNSRTLLNTSEAEHYGLDALGKLIDINRPAVDALDDNAIDGRQVTQAELLEGMQSGKYNATDVLGPIDGVRQLRGEDGTTRYEATHVVVKDPSSTVEMTPEMYDRFATAGIPGFPSNVNETSKRFELKFSTLQRANEMLASRTLADFRLNDLRQVLSGTPYADKVPSSVDYKQPGVVTALTRFQRYVSHADVHGLDVYESLQAMGAAKRNADGTMQPNPDAKYVDAVAQTFGGWPVLKAAHDKLEADSAATKAKAEARARGDEEIDTARRMVGVKAVTAGAEAEARQRVLASSAKNEDGSWNPASIPVGLVEGTMDPSQLSKRSADYNAKLQQANEYSLQKYGKPFDIAKAQSDFKYATNPATQNTMRYLNSLTGADNNSGNLGVLESMSNKINRTSFPALNDVAAWTRLQTGDAQMAAYRGAVTEVADQVAKILQGGGTGNGTSDAKLKQASELFDQGFSKDQILSVSNTLRTLLANRKSELIGDNRYLLRQFGQRAGVPTPTGLTNLHTNPQTGQTIGWDGKQWLDVRTRQVVK